MEYVGKEVLKRELNIGNLHQGIIDAICNIIDEIPKADVQEVKHGHWSLESHTIVGLNLRWNEWHCSRCGVIVKKGWSTSSEELKELKPAYCYCFVCGASMDQEENNNV